MRGREGSGRRGEEDESRLLVSERGRRDQASTAGLLEEASPDDMR